MIPFGAFAEDFFSHPDICRPVTDDDLSLFLCSLHLGQPGYRFGDQAL
jgi:hypothetical protein